MPYNYRTFINEIELIVSMFEERGYLITKEQAFIAWESYSADLYAGWLDIHLDSFEELVPKYILLC